MKTILNKIAKAINKSKSIAVITHVDPDGDALGSSFGFTSTFSDKAYLLNPKNIREPFINWNMINLIDGENFKADLLIYFDCAEKDRASIPDIFKENNQLSICIDHHASNEGFADINWIDPNYASTGEMLYKLLNFMDVEINYNAAKWLYIALVTDTGRFLYDKVDSNSHLMAADLVSRNINKEEIHKEIFQSNTMENFLLYRKILDNIEFFNDNKASISFYTLDDLKKYNIEEEDTDIALHQMRDIKGVDVAILIKPFEKNKYKVSLRSKANTDVAKIAEQFNGGGHIRAAGCTILGSLEEIKTKLIKSVINR